LSHLRLINPSLFAFSNHKKHRMYAHCHSRQEAINFALKLARKQGKWFGISLAGCSWAVSDFCLEHWQG